MENVEIEKKYLVKKIPGDLNDYRYHEIEQAYLCTAPVVRVRKEDGSYYLTYKGKGVVKHAEYNLDLNKESYEHLRSKADGNIITKKRYLIPLEGTDLTAELDIFEGSLAPLVIVEVEFPDDESSDSFVKPEWFGEEVTHDPAYRNASLATKNI